MVLWFRYYGMHQDVINVAMYYLVIIPDTTDEFLPGDSKHFYNLYFEKLPID